SSDEAPGTGWNVVTMSAVTTSKPAAAIPRAQIIAALEPALTRSSGAPVRINGMRRRCWPYRSTASLYELTLRCQDGRQIELLLKDLSPEAVLSTARGIKPSFLIDATREISVYRHVLAATDLGTADCYGWQIDEATDRYWLFLEKVPARGVYQVGDFEPW